MRSAAALLACIPACIMAGAPHEAFAQAGAEPDAPTITLYDEPGYRGRSVTLDGDAPDLARVGADDMATSLRSTGGRWEVCLEPGFKGPCHRVEADRPDFSAWAFNDRISSVRALHRPPPDLEAGVTLYSGRNYTGESLTLVRARPDLRRDRFNDVARSIKVHSGGWTLCRHADFLGYCVELDRDSSDLRLHRMDDRLSSIGPVAVTTQVQGGASRAGRLTGAVQGVAAVYFAEPELDGHPVAACAHAEAEGCGAQAAEQACRAAGLSGALSHGASPVESGPAWTFDTDSPGETGAVLVDLLCAR
ncbi:MAG: beta/gamma crystallin-related protein [Oceanicaulis sp.]